jgi:predicted nicotinamide N-methyase
MNSMRTIVAVVAALAGSASVVAAQQPTSPPARRPRAAHPATPQAARMVVYKSPT